MIKGLFDANLGSGLYKKRIPAKGRGKRGGYRTLVAFQIESKAFFIYGFSKNELDNVKKKEEKIYRQLAKDFLNMDDTEITYMVENNKLYEVK